MLDIIERIYDSAKILDNTRRAIKEAEERAEELKSLIVCDMGRLGTQFLDIKDLSIRVNSSVIPVHMVTEHMRTSLVITPRVERCPTCGQELSK
jgi:hypothetical protein